MISTNLTNNSIITTDDLKLTLNLSSNEHGILTYNFNNGGPSGNVDLGEGKHTIVPLTPVYDLNTLTVTVLDLHGNAQQHYFAFTFSEEASCSDAIQNGGETGIDCGGSCPACIAFEVTLDKTTFDEGEDVYLTVVSRTNSTVNMTVYKDSQVSYRHLFTPVFEGAPIAETRLIGNTSISGLYVIVADMNYLTHTETKTLNFDMLPPQNNLQVSISANATTINEGNAVPFTASVSGASGTVSYSWDFDNDQTIDSTEQNPKKIFNKNGTFKVNLTVTDSENQASALTTITLRKLFNVSFTVKEKGT